MDASTLPRLLILDMISMGTVTGRVNSNLFRNWPTDRLLQVASPKLNDLSLVRAKPDGKYIESPCDVDTVLTAIRGFAPDLILYRPLPERPLLHALALSVIVDLDLPLVTWVMDDWPSRLFAENKATYYKFTPSFKELLKRSVLRLSNCDAMSDAFAERYELTFQAFADGVDLSAWPEEPKVHKKGPLLLRYAGDMDPEVSTKSIQGVVEAVQELADGGQQVRFEINARPQWTEQCGAQFDGSSATKVSSHKHSVAEYAAWLTEADALLIAYNFDQASSRYLRCCMANKLPEHLGSGVPILAYGPHKVATIDYLVHNKAAVVVDSEDIDALKTALVKLTDPIVRQNLAATGRVLAQDNHSLPTLERKLTKLLKSACCHEDVTNFGFYISTSNGGFSPVNHNLANADKLLSDDATGLLVYPDPLSVVAAATEKDETGQDALVDWQIKADEQLTLYRKMRHKIQIVEHSNVAPPAVRAVAPGILGQKLREDDPLFYVLANLLLTKNALASRTLAELRTSGGVPSNEYSKLNLSGAIVNAQNRNSGKKKALPEDSKQLLQEQLILQQASTETYFHNAEQMRLGLTGASNTNNSCLEAQVGALQLEIEDIHKSRSWRITRPLRGVVRRLGALRERK